MSEHRQREERSCDPQRRAVVKLLGMAAGAVVASGCGAGEELPLLRIALADLPEGRPVETYVGDEPVELYRRGDTVQARSLWCTHMGCRVHREESPPGYRCPCHDGRFGVEGEVISGPPREPLRSMNVRIEGEVVIVEPQAT